MTKARIREMRARATDGIRQGQPPTLAALAGNVLECLTTIEDFNRRARRGEDLSTDPQELPLAAKVNPASKARGTQAEMEAFAIELKLPADDGEYFFHKMLATDWKVGGKPIKDWRAQMRSWRAGKFFPSQKNGTAAPAGPSRCIL